MVDFLFILPMFNMDYIIYDPESGEIVKWGRCPERDVELQKIPGFEMLLASGNPSENYISDGKLKKYNYDQSVLKNQQHPSFYKWSNVEFKWLDTRTESEKSEHLKSEVRNRRSALLRQSDWTQLPDVPLVTKQAWVAYRQSLRDITEQPGFPLEVTWPTAPTES